MNSHELYTKLKAALDAIEQYQKENNNKQVEGGWAAEVKAIIPELQKKSFMLGAAGRPCSKCNGTGRE
jgi:hypothetical protein